MVVVVVVVVVVVLGGRLFSLPITYDTLDPS